MVASESKPPLMQLRDIWRFYAIFSLSITNDFKDSQPIANQGGDEIGCKLFDLSPLWSWSLTNLERFDMVASHIKLPLMQTHKIKVHFGDFFIGLTLQYILDVFANI